MLVDSEILKDDTILALAWLESDKETQKGRCIGQEIHRETGLVRPEEYETIRRAAYCGGQCSPAHDPKKADTFGDEEVWR